MTREEALEWFKDRKKMNLADKCQQAEDRAIKALEQEPVLDNIRAEIDQKQYDFMSDGDYDEGIRFGLMLAYQIIDKYRAESEGEE